MSTVSLARTWYFNVGTLSPYVSGGALIQNQQTMFAIKNMIKGTNTGKHGWLDKDGGAVATPAFWTVYYSCDSAVAGTAGDGVDRWSSYDKLVWGTVAGANSWIVLYNATAGLYMLLNCEHSGSDSNTLDIWLAQTAFTGGTTTARPTSTDEWNVSASATWGAGSAFSVRYHMMMSDDGLSFRLYTTRAQNLQGLWIFEPMVDPVDNLVGDMVTAVWGGTAGNALSANTFTQTAQVIGRKTGGPTISGVLTSEGSRYSTNIQATLTQTDRPVWNDVAERDQIFAIGAYGVTYTSSGAMRGHLGSLADLWFGNDLFVSGRSWPKDYSRQLITLGPLVTPWPGLVPELQ